MFVVLSEGNWATDHSNHTLCERALISNVQAASYNAPHELFVNQQISLGIKSKRQYDMGAYYK